MDTEQPETTAPPQPEAAAGAIGAENPLPMPFLIPPQLLDQWVALPPETVVEAALTKHDIDQLYFGLMRSSDAQGALERTLVEWSNGRMDTANLHLSQFRRLNADGQNHYRQFFTGLLVAALRGKNRG